VSSTDLVALIEQYRTGLEAKRVLLLRLQDVALDQQKTTETVDVDQLQRVADERDALTSGFVAITERIRPAHERLTREKSAALRLPSYHHLVDLQQTVDRMVKDILEIDQDSIRALEQIVADRRAATLAAEQAEATLAAYARMIVPAPTSPRLLNRRG
jgi:hypothetical protein